MKIIFISDIHGNLTMMDKFREIMEREQPDKLAILGDVLYHGPRNPLAARYDTKGVAEILNSFGDKIIAVRGNCDSEVDQMVIEYPMMSDYAMISDEKRTLFLTHGHIFHPQRLPKLNPGDIFISGHTHIPVCEKTGNVYVFNPGSLGYPKGGFKASYGLYHEGKISAFHLEDSSEIVSLKL